MSGGTVNYKSVSSLNNLLEKIPCDQEETCSDILSKAITVDTTWTTLEKGVIMPQPL